MCVPWRWLSACLCTTSEKISLEYLEDVANKHNLKKGQNWPHKDGNETIQYHPLIPSSETIFKFNKILFIQMSCGSFELSVQFGALRKNMGLTRTNHCKTFTPLQPPCCSPVSPVLLQELALSWREDVQIGMQCTVHFFTNLQKGKEGRFGGSTL